MGFEFFINVFVSLKKKAAAMVKISWVAAELKTLGLKSILASELVFELVLLFRLVFR